MSRQTRMGEASYTEFRILPDDIPVSDLEVGYHIGRAAAKPTSSKPISARPSG